MTTTLPTVGGDSNTWGSKLNTWLSEMPFYNVKAYGALGNGSSDDTTAIQATINAANSAGGGVVFFPTGTYISGTLTFYSSIHFLGSGIKTTIIKLKNGTNGDLLHAYQDDVDLSAEWASGSNVGAEHWSIRNMTLDGNKDNQSSGPSYPLRFYGRFYIIDSLHIKNGYTGGLQCDWNPGSEDHDEENCYCNMRIMDCNGIGWDYGGGSDAQVSNVVVSNSQYVDIHIGVHAGGFLGSNIHVWNQGTGSPATIGILLEADSCSFTNCEVEGESGVMLVILCDQDFTWRGGRIFGGNLGADGFGIQFGQVAGNTPYYGQIKQEGGLTYDTSPVGCIIESTFDAITASGGCINFVGNGGGNIFQINGHLQSDGVTYTGDPYFADNTFDIQAFSTTQDGEINTCGGHIFGGKDSKHALEVLRASDLASIMCLDTYSSPPNLVLNAVLAISQSATAVAITNGSTIDASVGTTRVNPGGNVTGIIMPAGSYPGQHCEIMNESAFTVTFAAVGTSRVADGTSAVIAANRLMILVWNSVTSKWYR